MKNSKLYHTLPTIRKVRRQLRRACQPLGREMKAIRSTFIMRNESGEDMLKVHRWKNRLMTTTTMAEIGRMNGHYQPEADSTKQDKKGQNNGKETGG